MTRSKRILGLALSALALFTGAQASAALLTLGGGSSIVTPSSNNVLGSGVTMLDNATISATGPVVLKFYFLGSESSFTNTLRIGSNSHAESDSGQPAAWPGTFLFSYTLAAAGAVPMSFTSSGFGGSLTPGGGDTAKSIAFQYLSCTNATTCWTSTPSNMVLFALDDSGAGPDDNHDDYVGYMVATPVPLPAAFWLLGSALLGLFGIGRRRAA